MKGKAKELFEKWYVKHNYEVRDLHDTHFDTYIIGFYGLDDSFQWGVYQDFADSLGYEVSTFVSLSDLSKYGWDITIHEKDMVAFRTTYFKTRQEARNAAIEKLNEIINQNN